MRPVLEEFKVARAAADKAAAVEMVVVAVVMVAAAEELAVETDLAVDADLVAADLELEAVLEVDVDLVEGVASDLVAEEETAAGLAQVVARAGEEALVAAAVLVVVSVPEGVVPEGVALGQAEVEDLEVAVRLEADAEDELLS